MQKAIKRGLKMVYGKSKRKLKITISPYDQRIKVCSKSIVHKNRNSILKRKAKKAFKTAEITKGNLINIPIIPNKIYQGDCLDLLPRIATNSVDMILCDLPYGVSQNKWDSIIPLDQLWEQYHRIIKDRGAIVLTATQPFTSQLIVSNSKHFKYEWVWHKSIASGQLNVNRQPLRAHESILVFYKKQPVYNQQMTKGKPYSIQRDAQGNGYGNQKPSQKQNDGYRHPRTVLEFNNPRIRGGHSTQKPVELMEYMINTYTKQGEVVLDNCIGSGTTAVACIRTRRYYIGMEINMDYYEIARKRIKEEKEKLCL